MCINAILKKMMSGSLMLAISGHAASSIPIVATVFAAQVTFASPSAAASPTKRNAQGLLSDMRVSLGMIARSYKDASGTRHRSTASVLEAVTFAARATERLEGALATPNGKAIADATGGLSKAIGDLQTRYALTVSQNKQAAQGMRYLNAAWKSYASRYILSKPANETRAVSKDEVRVLRKRVSLLEKRVASLEDQVASNAALRREVVRLRQDLAYYDDRPDDYRTYQSMLLTLTIVSGSFDAFAYTTRTYYPTYHVYFEPIHPEFEVWHSYWDGYYDGYYAGQNFVWYNEPTIVEGPLVEINQIEISQDITYQTIYNMTNETRIEYEALPEESLADSNIPATPDDAIFMVQELPQQENGSAILNMDEARPATVELNHNSAQSNEAIEPSNDQAPDMDMPQRREEFLDSAEQQHKEDEEEVIPSNDRDDAADLSGDRLEKGDVSSQESDSYSDQLRKAGQVPR
ncbi:hypothetical protein HGP16_32490 [Rhizobium sp. P40RR-XXII]|uniref:hypothetical protein n=1 Tax=unclassified Rhizobium TaxID=2613769 RepID=UPI001456D1C2|nr:MULTISPECIES: hypothetical protein [unclassified Rhizobium]NLR89359.1 hypothetical protein [Rhizobium sp. P28RR-XV]NLS21219.1 hypothetical protein [Rhizobium sp. P40RR-XXII]